MQERQEFEKSTKMGKEARLCIFNEYSKQQELVYVLLCYQSWDLCEWIRLTMRSNILKPKILKFVHRYNCENSIKIIVNCKNNKIIFNVYY